MSFKKIAASVGLWLSTPATAASLASVCSVAYIQSILPPASSIENLVLLPESVTAIPVANFSIAASSQAPGRSHIDFCNVTLAYHHAGSDTKYNLAYWLPSPEFFEGRFLATGGGGYSITSGQRGLATGLVYGAVTGTTDGGFGSWNAQLTDVLLKGNGTLDYDMLYSFAYKAIHEMTLVGKELTARYYSTTSKVYTYYTGCSEGGREGWSQVQRYGAQYDGAAVGAPAFRQIFLQVMHLFGAVVEAEHKYYPPACELAKIGRDAIDACDLLDGKKDGVVSRTDLCRLHFNATASVGSEYKCAASSGPSFGPGGPGGPPAVRRRQFAPPAPASSGTVSLAAAQIATDFWRGLFDKKTGKQAYISYPPSSSFSDTATAFDAATNTYGPNVGGIGAQFFNYFLREQAVTGNSLAVVDARNLTSDDLVKWILEGVQKYSDTLQTDWPLLTDFASHGGKVLHYHGESDGSIPVGSSVLYHDSVRRTMYPGLGFNESHAALSEWYRLFLVPGAGHCGPSQDQPNGPWPQTVLDSLIAWVEKDENPRQLNATVFGGDLRGQTQTLCSFPLRPMWTNDTMDCVYDEAVMDSWLPKLDGFPLKVY